MQKLKLETEAREAAERKAEELAAEVNQLKLLEVNRAKEEVEIERNMMAGEFIDFPFDPDHEGAFRAFQRSK